MEPTPDRSGVPVHTLTEDYTTVACCFFCLNDVLYATNTQKNNNRKQLKHLLVE